MIVGVNECIPTAHNFRYFFIKQTRLKLNFLVFFLIFTDDFQAFPKWMQRTRKMVVTVVYLAYSYEQFCKSSCHNRNYCTVIMDSFLRVGCVHCAFNEKFASCHGSGWSATECIILTLCNSRSNKTATWFFDTY